MVYKLKLSRSKTEDARDMELHNPADMPDINRIAEIQEPWIEATIYCPEARGRGMCERLKDLIPRHLFKIPIQVAPEIRGAAAR